MTEELQNILQKVKNNPKPILIAASRKKLINFSRYMQPTMEVEPFHAFYYEVLDRFAHGLIKKLIVTMPPQHGKSEGSSRKLPAFMHGLNPDLKISIGSYESTTAQDFNKDVQKLIESEEYAEIFPETYLNSSGKSTFNNVYKKNTHVYEVVGSKGSLRAVGRGGALTSKSIDISILDDVYKDYEEANSPVIRKKAWKWYTTVVRKRLHNNSQELIVFTRWHPDDIIGRIEKLETVIDITCLQDLENIPQGAWGRINFQAIKTGAKTEIDQREEGTALWENRHSIVKLTAERKLDPVQFELLNQGNTDSSESKLYGTFKEYVDVRDWGTVVSKGNYTDVADEGDDYLCSICYDRLISPEKIFNEKTKRFEQLIFLMVKDVIYTQESTDETSVTVPAMLNTNGTQTAHIESNNGGRGFATTITKKTHCAIKPFYQGGNKESRVTTNAGTVTQHVIMPRGWKDKFPLFHEHVTDFLRDFSGNDHDDAPDCLTGMIEKEILTLAKTQGIKRTN